MHFKINHNTLNSKHYYTKLLITYMYHTLGIEFMLCCLALFICDWLQNHVSSVWIKCPQKAANQFLFLIKIFISIQAYIISKDKSKKLIHGSLLKVPISSKFVFSYLILYITQWTSGKEKFDLDKMQSFLEVLKTFRFAAILVHHSHQSSPRFEWVVT